MGALREPVAAMLRAAGLPADEVRGLIETALAEDLAHGPDATTSATVPSGAVAVAELTPRRRGTAAGIPVALAVFDLVLDGDYELLGLGQDGLRVAAGNPVLALRGPVRGLLTAERTALNLLCHLCGVATATADWVHAVHGTGTVVRDTRKTMPGMRALQKYAVRCGGGRNHRMGLGDAILIKDNHVVAAGSVGAALAAARAAAPELPAEVEVDSLAQLDEALASGAREILLDNFTPQQCAEAVRNRAAAGSTARLEASGGISLRHARQYAESGVDYLAVGALTHSAAVLDVGMDLHAA